MKKYIIISDLHGILPEINEQFDCLLICGDICPVQFDRDYYLCLSWLQNDFINYINNLNCEKVILIPGNHDFIFWHIYKNISENSKEIKEYIFNKTNCDKLDILIDDFIIYDNKKIYGTSWCPELKNWAFYGDEETLINKFNMIPKDTNILLTHCPPKVGNAGIVLQKCRNINRDFGCIELTNTLNKLNNLDFVFCGHIHSGEHSETHLNNIKIVNVSILDEFYRFKFNPTRYII